MSTPDPAAIAAVIIVAGLVACYSILGWAVWKLRVREFGRQRRDQ